MKYVLDSSVATKWVVPEALSNKAQGLRDDFVKGIHEFLAPDVFPVKIAHALTRAERQKRITLGQALALWSDVLSTPPLLYQSQPLLVRAIGISSTMRLGVYDCLYVALAEQENCEMVTADDRLVKNLLPTFPFIVALASLP